MSFWAYLLRCADGTFYTGHTDDLERRTAEHHAGLLPCYTQGRRPLALVWCETFATREEAITAELQIKRWSQAKKNALIVGDWDALKLAAAPPHERSARRAGVSTSLDTNGGG